MHASPPVCGEHAPSWQLAGDAAAVVAVPQSTSGTTSSPSQEPLHCPCWACGVAVQVPMVNDLPAPVFKCGWCGAITEYLHVPLRPRPDSFFRMLMRWLSNIKWGVVVAVTLLCLSIILPGAVVLLPQTCGFGTFTLYLNEFITAFLAFNTMYNFAASIAIRAGTVKECYPVPVQTGTSSAQGVFNDFKYCYSCKYFKPPAAHHCSVCRTCVVDMDHHCPFINNCVGRANMRNFIAFLVWIMFSVLFCMAHTIFLLLVIDRPALTGAFAKAWGMRRYPWDIFLMTPFVIMSTPWKTLVPMYLFSMTVCLAVACGILLAGQIECIWSTVTSHQHYQQLQHQLFVQAGAGMHGDPGNPAGSGPGAGAGANGAVTGANGAGAHANGACAHSHGPPTGGAGGHGGGGRVASFRRSLPLFVARFQEIMGGPTPMHWLWPHWGPLPGTCLEAAKKQL